MALLPLHKFFVFNDEIKANTAFISSENKGGIYEVLRVSDGVPLFLEDHLDRFYCSAKIVGRSIRFSKYQIENFLFKLIEKNEVDNGNILISCKTNLKAFFIASSYPTEKMYKTGVKCGLLNAERENPNVKILHTTVRQMADQLIKEKGYYEVLLLDKKNRITEGSRSNVFFIKGNEIITPQGNKVLQGITRQKIIEIAKKAGFQVKEEIILLSELDNFTAVFITGTSPKILPVKQMGNVTFNSKNEVVKVLVENYNELILKYIQQKSIQK
ncbi:MAG: aminotransferase class IV [Prolixibacteraceae bacterium]|jgi:branched-chain amino acid aminotransferase|nr:aminotransferase class IV [Prolixibacteraceae bacterium]MBT6006188.1 aminotransferase class IV [Prolixibacteraceae bacterium]MBT6765505.1 aminotransferase class IV [Prolixibacteraceae bacterium]MBT6997050.1 aminotransferase class IV [Prolixibacteraceae bacterium]MBT7396895.1 aminotransferase class IV [Prolixibacteraceae bacterium]